MPDVRWNLAYAVGEVVCINDCFDAIRGGHMGTRRELIKLWNERVIAETKNYPRPALRP